MKCVGTAVRSLLASPRPRALVAVAVAADLPISEDPPGTAPYIGVLFVALEVA